MKLETHRVVTRCAIYLRCPLSTRLAVPVTSKPPVHQNRALEPVTPLLVCSCPRVSIPRPPPSIH
ncbi:hypothetical protein IG631_18685 [Alternaria alternata]|nr:hypothetical protein IG631_18685 [Alternaria alternata]